MMEHQAFNESDQHEVRVSQRGDRKINQDRCEIFSHEDIKVLVLADGMGGHPKGEVAAQLLVDTTYHLLKDSSSTDFDPDLYIEEVLQTAHKKILTYGTNKNPPIFPRTTAVIVVIKDNMMYWSHLGDSRTYLFRHGRAHLRTMDHTRVEAMRLSGQIADTDSQSTAVGRSGVSRCLGGKKKITDIEITPATRLLKGDILLLCSDGVWSQLKEAELEAIMLEPTQTLEQRVNTLVCEAVTAGHPGSDNATALAFCWQPPDNRYETVKPATVENNSVDQDGVDSAVDHLRELINKF